VDLPSDRGEETQERTRAAADRRHLTERALAEAVTEARSEGLGRRIVWDSKVAGFGAVVGGRTVTFVVQRRVGRRGAGRRVRRVSIGRWPSPWTVEAARAKAREALQAMDSGVDPSAVRAAEEAVSVTLGGSVEVYVDGLRKAGRSARWIEDSQRVLRRYLEDWWDRPLAGITRAEVATRHDRITREHGAVSANLCFRAFRACWSVLRKRVPEVGECPTAAITWNAQEARRDVVPPDLLPAWRERVEALEERERVLWWTIALTGLRSEDARSIQWEDLDLDRGVLRRPNPKGGRSRAFEVPVASHLLSMLRARRRSVPEGCPWVFPSVDRAGQVTHLQNLRALDLVVGRRTLPDGTQEDVLATPHVVRRTFASAAVAAGVSYPAVQALLNHAPASRDVTLRHYVRLDVEALRPEVEKVAAWVVGRMRGTLSGAAGARPYDCDQT